MAWIAADAAMTKRTLRRKTPDAPVMHYVDGKQVIPGHYNRFQLFIRFLLEPFTGAWHHRDLIVAILRRELRARFRRSGSRWGGAPLAPPIPLVTLTVVVWWGAQASHPQTGKLA